MSIATLTRSRRVVPAPADLDGDAPVFRPEEILTRDGGPIEVSAEERAQLLIYGDGRTFVTRAYRTDPRVQGLAARARRMGLTPNIQERTIGDIAKAYEIAENRNGFDETQTRLDLKELIDTAAKARATDIRIRARAHDADIYFRINGSMVKHKELSAALGEALCVVAFNVGEGDASYSQYNYQATRITRKGFDLPDSVDALRLQYSPLENGGRLCAIRLLFHVLDAEVRIESLGYTAEQEAMLAAIRQQPTGVILVVGPTGSGKSTTLYATLETLYRETRGELNMISIEDPIERHITGVTQIPVSNVNTEEERQSQFHKAIISALRSDPDGVMIGEIRDGESARLAFQATMTGHFVYSTLHANDAMAALPRLREIGVPPYLLFDSRNIIGVIAQRLVRLLCPYCKIPLLGALRRKEVRPALFNRASEVLDLRQVRLFHRGRGCPWCQNSGYIGQTVIGEVIRPSDQFMNLLADNRNNDARQLWLAKGGQTMAMHARNLLLDGCIDLDEFEQEAGSINEALAHPSDPSPADYSTETQIRSAA